MADTDGGAGAQGGDAATQPEVEDRPEERRLVIDLEGSEAELTYRHGPGRLTLVHTGVPEALNGRGLGGLLVRSALDKARREGLTVAPWCPFARRWIEEHPEEASTVELDMAAPPAR